jgi:hypothetical protein
MDNCHPKLDMDNILPVDIDKVYKVADELVEEENEEERILVEMNNDATLKVAFAFASESPSVHLPLPGAYHVAPSPTAASVAALQGRASSFNRSLISIYRKDHTNDDDATIIVVPTASVVQ